MRAFVVRVGAAMWCAAAAAAALTLAADTSARAQGRGPAAAASDTVKGEVSVSTAGGYARIVFRMDEQMDAAVTLSGNILIISFRKPIMVPLDGLAAGARDYISVSRRDPDGRAVRIALTRKLRVNKQVAGERLYFDLLPTTWAGTLPGLPQEVVEDLARRAREAERKLRAQQPAAPAVPTIRVKVGTQPTFTRYVFDLPAGVSVSTERTADLLRLKFTSPINFDLADTRDGMPPMLDGIDSDLEHDFVAVNFHFNNPPDVRAFREEHSFIVDVATRSNGGKPGADNAAAPPPVLQAPDTIPAKNAGSAKESAKEAAPDAPKLATKPEAPRPASAAVEPPAPEPARPGLAKAEPPKIEPLKTEAAKAEQLRTEPAEIERAKIEHAKIEHAKPESVERDAGESRPVAAASAAAAPPGASAAAPVRVELRRQGDSLQVTVPFRTETPAAVFVRADTVWMVFDTGESFDLAALQDDSQRVFRSVAVKRPQPDVAVLRLKLDRPRLLSAAMTGPRWTLSLGDAAETTPRSLAIARNIIGPHRSSITIPFDDPRKLHRLSDPEQGDDLLVVTALGPARGFSRTQNFVDLRALASVHGVAIEPLADDLTADLGTDRIVIGRPGGLALSNAVGQGAAGSSRSAALDPQLWGFDRQADFNLRQSELMAKAAATPAAKRLPARLDIARFYLARDMYPEAKAVLDVALSDDTASDADVTGVVLRAVTNVMLDRPEEALKDLAHPLVGRQYDAPVWRALAFADQGHWAEAREAFREAQTMIATLPVELQRIALRKAVRAAIEVKDFAGAARQLAEFETIGVPPQLEPALTVLNGRIAEGQGNPAEALRYYRLAADSSDRGAAAQGRLRELALRYGKSEINRTDMIAELETLTAVWRGDETEVEAQQVLARLYTEEHRYRDAFRVMRSALLAHPTSRTTREIQDEAAATFERLFLAGAGDSLPPVEALGLFYDYRELTPIGRRGDEMIRRLADRLAAVDLLDQAAELLQHQVDHRLQGAARAQVATRLATIYLMNRKPDRALAALRASRAGDLSNELRGQRLLLEARALADIGRVPLALEVIENLDGREAMRLRADILWSAKRWTEAAEQIEKLYGDRWKEFAPLTADERDDILRAGVGYVLGEEMIGLGRLRERYAGKMAEGDDRRAFAVVTGGAGASDPEFGRIASAVASYDALGGFLRALRERYPETGAPSRQRPVGEGEPLASAPAAAPQSQDAAPGMPATTGSILSPRRMVALPRPRPASITR